MPTRRHPRRLQPSFLALRAAARVTRRLLLARHQGRRRRRHQRRRRGPSTGAPPRCTIQCGKGPRFTTPPSPLAFGPWPSCQRRVREYASRHPWVTCPWLPRFDNDTADAAAERAVSKQAVVRRGRPRFPPSIYSWAPHATLPTGDGTTHTRQPGHSLVAVTMTW